MKRLLASITLAALICSVGYSQTITYHIPKEEYFTAKEFQLSLASSWTTPAKDLDITEGAVGVVINGTKFFNEYAGATAEIAVSDLYNVGNLVINQVSLGGTLRYPVGHIAPYARVLVGRDFERALYKFDTGAGLEYRFTKHIGAFVESRYQFFIDNSDKIIGLGGISLAF